MSALLKMPHLSTSCSILSSLVNKSPRYLTKCLIQNPHWSLQVSMLRPRPMVTCWGLYSIRPISKLDHQQAEFPFNFNFYLLADRQNKIFEKRNLIPQQLRCIIICCWCCCFAKARIRLVMSHNSLKCNSLASLLWLPFVSQLLVEAVSALGE